MLKVKRGEKEADSRIGDEILRQIEE